MSKESSGSGISAADVSVIFSANFKPLVEGKAEFSAHLAGIGKEVGSVEIPVRAQKGWHESFHANMVSQIKGINTKIEQGSGSLPVLKVGVVPAQVDPAAFRDQWNKQIALVKSRLKSSKNPDGDMALPVRFDIRPQKVSQQLKEAFADKSLAKLPVNVNITKAGLRKEWALAKEGEKMYLDVTPRIRLNKAMREEFRGQLKHLLTNELKPYLTSSDFSPTNNTNRGPTSAAAAPSVVAPTPTPKPAAVPVAPKPKPVPVAAPQPAPEPAPIQAPPGPGFGLPNVGARPAKRVAPSTVSAGVAQIASQATAIESGVWEEVQRVQKSLGKAVSKLSPAPKMAAQGLLSELSKITNPAQAAAFDLPARVRSLSNQYPAIGAALTGKTQTVNFAQDELDRRAQAEAEARAATKVAQKKLDQKQKQFEDDDLAMSRSVQGGLGRSLADGRRTQPGSSFAGSAALSPAERGLIESARREAVTATVGALKDAAKEARARTVPTGAAVTQTTLANVLGAKPTKGSGKTGQSGFVGQLLGNTPWQEDSSLGPLSGKYSPGSKTVGLDPRTVAAVNSLGAVSREQAVGLNTLLHERDHARRSYNQTPLGNFLEEGYTTQRADAQTLKMLRARGQSVQGASGAMSESQVSSMLSSTHSYGPNVAASQQIEALIGKQDYAAAMKLKNREAALDKALQRAGHGSLSELAQKNGWPSAQQSGLSGLGDLQMTRRPGVGGSAFDFNLAGLDERRARRAGIVAGIERERQEKLDSARAQYLDNQAKRVPRSYDDVLREIRQAPFAPPKMRAPAPMIAPTQLPNIPQIIPRAARALNPVWNKDDAARQLAMWESETQQLKSQGGALSRLDALTKERNDKQRSLTDAKSHSLVLKDQADAADQKAKSYNGSAGWKTRYNQEARAAADQLKAHQDYVKTLRQQVGIASDEVRLQTQLVNKNKLANAPRLQEIAAGQLSLFGDGTDKNPGALAAATAFKRGIAGRWRESSKTGYQTPLRAYIQSPMLDPFFDPNSVHFDPTGNKMGRTRTQPSAAVFGELRAAKAQAQLGQQISTAFTAPMAGLTKFWQGLGQNLTKKVEEQARLAQRRYMSGATLSFGLTMPVLGAAAVGIREATQIDSTLHKIAALTDVSKADMPVLEDKFFDMSKKLPQSANEIAASYYYIASNDYKGKDAQTVLDVSTMGAAGGLGRTEAVADVLTSALVSYEAPASMASVYSDQLVAGVKMGKGEAAEFAPAIGKVLGEARVMGIGFDEVIANVATMSRVGMKPSEGANSLNMLLQNLGDPSMKGERTLEMIGTSGDAVRSSLREKGLLATLSDLMDLSGGNIEIISRLVGSVRGLRNILITAGAQKGSYEKILKSVQGSQGFTQEAFDTMSGSAAFKNSIALNKIKAVALEPISKVLPGISDAAGVASDAVVKAADGVGIAWKGVPDDIQKATLMLTGFALAAGPLLQMRAFGGNIGQAGLDLAGFGTRGRPSPLLKYGAAGVAGYGASKIAGAMGAQDPNKYGWAVGLGLAAPMLARDSLGIGRSAAGGIGNLMAYGTRQRAELGRTISVMSGLFRGETGLSRFGPNRVQMGPPRPLRFDRNGIGSGFAQLGGMPLFGSAGGVGSKTIATLPFTGGMGTISQAGALGAAGAGVAAVGIGVAATMYQNYQRAVDDAANSQHNFDVAIGNTRKALNGIGEDLTPMHELFGGEKPKGTRDIRPQLQAVQDAMEQAVASNNPNKALSALAESKRLKNKLIAGGPSAFDLSEFDFDEAINGLDGMGGMMDQVRDSMQEMADAATRAANPMAEFFQTFEDGSPGIFKFIEALSQIPGDFLADFAPGGHARLREENAEQARPETPAWVYTPENREPLFTLDDMGVAGFNVSNPQKAPAKVRRSLYEQFKTSRPTNVQLDNLNVANLEIWLKDILAVPRGKRTKEDVENRSRVKSALKRARAEGGDDTPADADPKGYEEAQKRAKEERAQRLRKEANHWTALGAAVDGAGQKIAGYAGKSDEARMRQELLKHSVDGLTQSYVNQALELGRISDAMERVAGQRDSMRGLFDSVNDEFLKRGITSNPFSAEIKGLEGYQGILQPLANRGERIQTGLSDLAEKNSERIQSEMNDNSYPLSSNIVSAAQSYVGQSNDNMDVRAEFAQRKMKEKGLAWCVALVDATLNKAGLPDLPGGLAVKNVRAAAQKNGTAYTGQPVAGDAVTILGGGESHISIVKDVLPSGKFTTIGGNEGGHGNVSASRVKDNNSYNWKTDKRLVFIKTRPRNGLSTTAPVAAQAPAAQATGGPMPYLVSADGTIGASIPPAKTAKTKAAKNTGTFFKALAPTAKPKPANKGNFYQTLPKANAQKPDSPVFPAPSQVTATPEQADVAEATPVVQAVANVPAAPIEADELDRLATVPGWMRNAWGKGVRSGEGNQFRFDLQSKLFSRDGIKNLVAMAHQQGVEKTAKGITSARSVMNRIDGFLKQDDLLAEWTKGGNERTQGRFMKLNDDDPYASLKWAQDSRNKNRVTSPSLLAAMRRDIGANLSVDRAVEQKSYNKEQGKSNAVLSAREWFLRKSGQSGFDSNEMELVTWRAGRRKELEEQFKNDPGRAKKVSGRLASEEAQKRRDTAAARAQSNLVSAESEEMAIALNRQLFSEKQAGVSVEELERKRAYREAYNSAKLADKKNIKGAQAAGNRARRAASLSIEERQYDEKRARNQSYAQDIALSGAEGDLLGSGLDVNSREYQTRLQRARATREAQNEFGDNTEDYKTNRDKSVDDKMALWEKSQNNAGMSAYRQGVSDLEREMAGLGDTTGLVGRAFDRSKSEIAGWMGEAQKAGLNAGDLKNYVASRQLEIGNATRRTRIKGAGNLLADELDPTIKALQAQGIDSSALSQLPAMEDARARAEAGQGLTDSAQSALMQSKQEMELGFARNEQEKERIKLKYQLLELQRQGIALGSEDLSTLAAISEQQAAVAEQAKIGAIYESDAENMKATFGSAFDAITESGGNMWRNIGQMMKSTAMGMGKEGLTYWLTKKVYPDYDPSGDKAPRNMIDSAKEALSKSNRRKEKSRENYPMAFGTSVNPSWGLGKGQKDEGWSLRGGGEGDLDKNWGFGSALSNMDNLTSFTTNFNPGFTGGFADGLAGMNASGLLGGASAMSAVGGLSQQAANTVMLNAAQVNSVGPMTVNAPLVNVAGGGSGNQLIGALSGLGAQPGGASTGGTAGAVAGAIGPITAGLRANKPGLF